MNSFEKNPADVAFFKALTERLEGVLRKRATTRAANRGLQITEEMSEIETTNQLENLTEEDNDEDLHEDNHSKEEDDKDVEGNRKTKNTTQSPAKTTLGAQKNERKYRLL
ncbi:hypothetical protein HHI36_022578 [Cryptolaemus montrouzieri]|uniref:Uncharacterized protein n=1 Tax=Cryptolaemus montrouzieri TaxID=559131 RepID=A0ABD2N068_9CUCU